MEGIELNLNLIKFEIFGSILISVGNVFRKIFKIILGSGVVQPTLLIVVNNIKTTLLSLKKVGQYRTILLTTVNNVPQNIV